MLWRVASGGGTLGGLVCEGAVGMGMRDTYCISWHQVHPTPIASAGTSHLLSPAAPAHSNPLPPPPQPPPIQ